MRKRGVFILLNLFIMSSLFLFFNLNDNNNDTNLANNDLIVNREDPLISIDTFEPNDNFAQAKNLTTPFKENLYYDDDDWFNFSVVQGQLIVIKIWFDSGLGDIDLFLRNDIDNPVAQDDSSGGDGDRQIEYLATYTGDYYIWINNDWGVLSYDLSIRLYNKTGIFSDDFDTGGLKPGWSTPGADNLWHVTSYDYYDPGYSLWCANYSTKNYDKGQSITDDSIAINNLDLRDFYWAKMTFWYNKSTDTVNDTLSLTANILGEQFYLEPDYTNNDFLINNSLSDTSFLWKKFTYDLSFLAGHDLVDLIFNFDTKNPFTNNFPGVKIDDVNITGYKDDIITPGLGLCLKVDDEFIYRINNVDSAWYANIFGQGIPWIRDHEIKIVIYAIVDQGDYWDITTRFWEPWDDWDSEGSAEEIIFKIYKNPLNYKDGADFFIPCVDRKGYFIGASNVWDNNQIGEDYQYYMGSWTWWGDDEWISEANLNYDDFKVNKEYNEDGVLRWLQIRKNEFWDDQLILLELEYLRDYEEDKDEDDEEEDLYVSIPGYDIYLLISMISVVSVILIMKIKKNRTR